LGCDLYHQNLISRQPNKSAKNHGIHNNLDHNHFSRAHPEKIKATRQRCKPDDAIALSLAAQGADAGFD
jgi:hypothetical protein